MSIFTHIFYFLLFGWLSVASGNFNLQCTPEVVTVFVTTTLLGEPGEAESSTVVASKDVGGGPWHTGNPENPRPSKGDSSTYTSQWSSQIPPPEFSSCDTCSSFANTYTQSNGYTFLSLTSQTNTKMSPSTTAVTQTLVSVVTSKVTSPATFTVISSDSTHSASETQSIANTSTSTPSQASSQVSSQANSSSGTQRIANTSTSTSSQATSSTHGASETQSIANTSISTSIQASSSTNSASETRSIANTSTSTSSQASSQASSSISTGPACTPSLTLWNAEELGFNPHLSQFAVNISCSTMVTANTTATANFKSIDGLVVNPTSIIFPGFSSGYYVVTVFTITTDGVPLIIPFTLLFGEFVMTVIAFDTYGQFAPNVEIQATATSYPNIFGFCTTDATGFCILQNVPPTAIELYSSVNQTIIGVNGIAGKNALIPLNLIPLHTPAPGASFNNSNGTTGWMGGTVVDQSFKHKVKRDTTLVVSTNGAFGNQSSSIGFPGSPFTTTAYIKYKFVTQEVPDGYFGNPNNDFFYISIRSNTGASIFHTSSMNSLGIGEFDASGSTDWYTLSLAVPQGSSIISYDIGVISIGDRQIDSQVVVEQVGEQDCVNCGDCSTCPTDPMCQDSCKSPKYMSCGFYLNCAEAKLNCYFDGYPVAIGNKNCNKFVYNIDQFSANGQDFVWSTMQCLQTAMVPVLQPCTATCSSFYNAAFDAHPTCYLANGLCSLSCSDLGALLGTVGTDIFKGKSVSQVLTTSGGCAQNLLQTIAGCAGESVFSGVNEADTEAILNTIIAWINS